MEKTCIKVSGFCDLVTTDGEPIQIGVIVTFRLPIHILLYFYFIFVLRKRSLVRTYKMPVVRPSVRLVNAIS